MQHSTTQFMDACITNYGWAMSNDITFHTKISIKDIIIIQTMSAIGEPKEMGSVDNDGGIAKGDPMKKGENEWLEELEEYDDYYDDLEACDHGNRRACRNAEFRQQLYEDMLVEKEKECDHHNAHVAAGKKAEKEGKFWISLQMKMKCVTRRPRKGRGTHSLNCLRLMEKKDWNVLKGNFKNNGKMCNIVVSRQENTTVHVEKLQKGVQDMQRILKRNLSIHFLRH
jgi:hypothetical protein